MRRRSKAGGRHETNRAGAKATTPRVYEDGYQRNETNPAEEHLMDPATEVVKDACSVLSDIVSLTTDVRQSCTVLTCDAPG